MAVTASTFRANYPEFSDTVLYPDSGVNYWLNLAGLLLNANKWQTVLDVGTELFVAHNLVIERMAQATAANGAPPGVSQGPIASKSVDKVSVSYDTNAGIKKDAGHWNLTVFGTRFIKLADMFGAGPIQVGAMPCQDPLSSSNAWGGPYPWPVPSGFSS